MGIINRVYVLLQTRRKSCGSCIYEHPEKFADECMPCLKETPTSHLSKSESPAWKII